MGCLLLLVLKVGVHYSWALVEPLLRRVHCSRFGGCWSELLLRCGSLSLFCNNILPNIGISVWEWRPELVTSHWNWNWSHLTFHLQKGLHFLYDSGMQMKPQAPGCTFDQLDHPVHSKNMHPLHGCNFHFYIHHFYWEFAPKEAMQEVALWLE